MPPLDGWPGHPFIQHLTPAQDMNESPAAPTAEFPATLAERRQWLIWRFVHKPGQKKPSKMPYYASGEIRRGVQGSDEDRAQLVDLEHALEAAREHDADGVGFAFLPGDGLIGIDLDAIDADEQRAKRARTIIDACASYTERSPSGRGVHIIVEGSTETFKSNELGIEVFCGSQFFTMTGHAEPGTPETVETIADDVLEKLRRTVRGSAPAPSTPPPAPARPVQTAASGSARYCLAALESAVQRMRSASEGGRNDLLNGEVYGLAQLVHTGGISEATIRGALRDAALSAGLPAGEIDATIRSAMRAGLDAPRALPEREQQHPRPAPVRPAAPSIDPETGEIIEPEQTHANDNFAQPLDLFAEFPAPPIRREMLPDVIADYAEDCGALIGVEPAMVAIPALVACAAALHDGVVIQPKRHETSWTESARLWCAIVGTPSVKKSPALRRATRRLRKIDADLAERNAREAAQHADQMEQFKAAKREAAKSGGGPLNAPERPVMQRMIVEDITVEALSDVLRDNARGVLCIQDELSGWFGSMDAYTGGKAGNKDRAAWLQAYNGGFRQVDRVQRGAVHVPNFSVSMIGGIQPDAIRRIAKDMTDDGLMQRFMIVIGRNAGEHDRAENQEVSKDYADLVDHLHRIQPGQGVVTLTEGAHAVRERLLAYAGELSEYPALPGGLRSHLGKWSGLFARLLLVYHAIECSGERVHPVTRPVSASTAGRVELLLRRFLLPHALAYYTDVLGASGDLEHARWVAGHILSKGMQEISNRELVQGYKAWRGLDDWRRQRAMQLLEDMDWVYPVTEDGRPASRRGVTQWVVNPRVHDTYATKASEEAERRGRIREEIAAMRRA